MRWQAKQKVPKPQYQVGKISEYTQYNGFDYALCSRKHVFTLDEEAILVSNDAEITEVLCPLDRTKLLYMDKKYADKEYDLTPLEDSMLPADEQDRSFAATAVKGLVFLILCFLIGVLVSIIIALWKTL